MKLLLLITYLGWHIEALVVENVFFNKVNEFSMSNSRWLITFVISIDHYGDFLSKLSMDIDKASNISESVLSIYTPEKIKPTIDPKIILYLRCNTYEHFGHLQTEISHIF